MDFELVNSTPFVPLSFESVDEKLNHFGVIVAQGTFHIVNNQFLNLATEQDALVLEDKYFSEAGSSSLRFDSALSPYKPKTDLLIEATSYSPSRQKQPSWTSSISAGPLSKSFVVTGPRQWSDYSKWQKISPIEPIDRLDIRYEHSYGGTNNDTQEQYLTNPVGKGFSTDSSGVRACPQILPFGVELASSHKPCQPTGLGPLAPAWQPRLARAGTFDETWVNTQAPYLPKDFSFEFYNVAPTDLTFPGFAKGDEIIQLVNLSTEPHLRFALPGISMITVLRFMDGRVVPGPMNLDTIHLLVEERKAILQWRGIFPAHIPMQRIELRMSAPDRMIEA